MATATGRRALTIISLCLTSAFALPATGAGAQPKPDVKTIQKKLQTLNAQVDLLVEKYDKSTETLAQAQRRKAIAEQQLAAEQTTYTALHDAVAQMAAAAYKNGGGDDAVTGVLAAKDPGAVLAQMSWSRRSPATAALSSLSSPPRPSGSSSPRARPRRPSPRSAGSSPP